MDAPGFNLAGYRHYLGRRKLMASRCSRCGALSLPPRPMCTACRARDMQWAELSGRGRVVTFTAITVVPDALAKQGFGPDRPLVTGFVALEEGPTVPARIECDGRAVEVGMAVEADFLAGDDEGQKAATLIFRAG